jgi:two-component system sensor histidine kinase KdpD
VSRHANEPNSGRVVARASLACIGAVAVASALVAALDLIAPVTGLGVIYLLAVLFVAIAVGEVAAIATALASALALNFLFIEPRYHLAVHDAGNVVALAVFLVAGLVVGRLAGLARQREAEAEDRARTALAREREAAILGAAASSLLEGEDVEAQLRSIERGGGSTTGTAGIRVELGPVPSPRESEVAIRLPTSVRPAWMYVTGDAVSLAAEDRFVPGLARLIDVAFERELLSTQAAEAEATRRADVAKTALLHAISHDLRSPLTAITTAASALDDPDLSGADRAELVSVIELESARLSGLVDDLLDLSRIEAEAVNPNPDWCDLRDVVVTAAAQPRTVHGDHPIEFRLPQDLPLVHADAAQLERVFANLIDNAIKFSPPGQPVTVSGSVAGGRVVVRVSDRGAGIPRSERARIFEPFVRGRGSGRGSGLGLAICRGFVEANGGRIALQTGTGKETSFAVSFPLVGQPAPV